MDFKAKVKAWPRMPLGTQTGAGRGRFVDSAKEAIQFAMILFFWLASIWAGAL